MYKEGTLPVCHISCELLLPSENDEHQFTACVTRLVAVKPRDAAEHECTISFIRFVCALLNEVAVFFESFTFVSHALVRVAVAQLQHMIKIWLSHQKAVKCHHDNGFSQAVYNHLPSSHFKFQTEIDLLAKERDESWLCNTYCSAMSQMVSLYLKKKKHELRFYFWRDMIVVHGSESHDEEPSIMIV